MERWAAGTNTSIFLISRSPSASYPFSGPLILCLFPKRKWSVLQSLYASNYDSNQQEIPSPTTGTCSWIFEHDIYKTWSRKQGSGLLWVSADPGCGKSALSSFLVNRFREPDSQAGHLGIVCCFFFEDGNENQKDATSALRALLHQLFKTKNSLIGHAIPEFQSKGSK